MKLVKAGMRLNKIIEKQNEGDVAFFKDSPNILYQDENVTEILQEEAVKDSKFGFKKEAQALETSSPDKIEAFECFFLFSLIKTTFLPMTPTLT